MVKSVFKKNVFREIRHSLGRYFAILSIVALGVGFFSGLQITQSAMLKTGDKYISDSDMYDFKLISTLGLTEADVAALSELEGICNAEGAYTEDAYCTVPSGEKPVLRFHSVSEKVGKLSVVSGRFPENAGECAVDARLFSDAVIGKKLTISDTNSDKTKKCFAEGEYTIVGTVKSVNYMNIERGTTTLDGGKVDGFVYIPTNGFCLDYFTELYLKADAEYEIYSEEYNNRIDALKPSVADKLSERAEIRYNDIISMIPEPFRALSGIEEPQTYVLTRAENVGYTCFESDAQIVSGIAKIFPIFFFAVAALVCTTTMTRMVSEQRTQIGTLKALGYRDSTILYKYVFYAGSSALIGGIAGYFAGTWLFPFTIWTAYSILYGFADILYVFNLRLALISVAVAMLCSAGVTFIVCWRELYHMPAELMRPKAPKAGKRILLERITPFWKRLSFLRKVSLRNIFRHRKRLYMMILGVGGCTALLLTGFGIRDSIANLVEYQFDEISLYDYTVCFDFSQTEADMDKFTANLSKELDSAVFVCRQSAKAETEQGMKSVELIASDDKSIVNFFDLHDGNRKKVAYPEKGEVVLSEKLASQMGVRVGDDVTLLLDDEGTVRITVRLSGICKSYVYNYAYMTAETYETASQQSAEYRYAYAKAVNGADTHEDGTRMLSYDGILSVAVTSDMRERVSNMMESLDLVVWLVIASAAALAFIVLINLSNINITERQREIATVKVLGFYPHETAAYVFRENLLLTLMGAVVGMPLGMALHCFVMSQIKVDMISLDTIILPMSYLFAFALTMVFTVLVDILMRRKLISIDMAESLKSVE